MTTKNSVDMVYLKAGEHGPEVHLVVFPTFSLVCKILWAWMMGTPIMTVEKLSHDRLKAFYTTIRHWYLVSNLRGYKHHAK